MTKDIFEIATDESYKLGITNPCYIGIAENGLPIMECSENIDIQPKTFVTTEPWVKQF